MTEAGWDMKLDSTLLGPWGEVRQDDRLELLFLS